MLDVVTLVRSLAIVFIVIAHLTTFDYGGGGALILMLLAGFTYARYILPKVEYQRESNKRHFLLIVKIAIPTFSFLFLQQLASPKSFNWPVVALYSNFVDPKMNGAWFIEVYLQINLFLLLIVQNERVRILIGSLKTFGRASMALVASVFLALISDLLWSADSLYNRVPTELFWFFSAGILMSACSSLIERAIFVSIVGAALFLTNATLQPFLLASVLAVAFVSKISFPKIGVKVVTALSGASLMIYLTHFFFAKVMIKLWSNSPAWANVTFALICGVILQYAYGMAWNKWRQRYVPIAIRAT